MAMTTGMIFSAALFFLTLSLVPALMEFFLARLEARWPGLILPALSIVSAGALALQSSAGGGQLWMALLVFLLFNIPTAVMLVIYFVMRYFIKRKKRREEEEKMRLRDL